MDAHFSKAENGLQLFGRLARRPNLTGLEPAIFQNGPIPNDVVEISGGPSSGKTLLLTHFIMKTVLPKSYKNFDVGGHNASVVLLNTDHHFEIFELVSLMEMFLVKCTSSDDKTKLNSTEIETLIKDSLQNLIIFKCNSSIELSVAIISLENLLLHNTNISLILLDSISAYYWQDSLSINKTKRMDLYASEIRKQLNKYLSDFGIVIMYTRPDYFQSKIRSTEECNVTHYIHFEQILKGEQMFFSAKISTPDSTVSRLYIINESGFHWSPETS